MKTAVYPGSFDPITLGHLDIIERSSKFFDRFIVGVLNNSSKVPLFSVKERVDMIQHAVGHLTNIEVLSFDGLLVDFAKNCGAEVIVRGLRAITDYDYEMQLSQMNRVMAPSLDTVFFNTSLKYAYLSSTTVKEVAKFGGDIDVFLPPYAADKVKEKYNIVKAKERKNE